MTTTAATKARLARIQRPQPACRMTGDGRRRTWSDTDDDILRREYDGTWRTVERLAIRLDRSFNAIKGRAQVLGLSKAKTPNWTPQEREYLETWGEKRSPQWLADHLPGRTKTAVCVQMKRMNLSRRLRDGWYTKREVCEMLGVDHKWVQRAIDSGELKAIPHIEGNTPRPLAHRGRRPAAVHPDPPRRPDRPQRRPGGAGGTAAAAPGRAMTRRYFAKPAPPLPLCPKCGERLRWTEPVTGRAAAVYCPCQIRGQSLTLQPSGYWENPRTRLVDPPARHGGTLQ